MTLPATHTSLLYEGDRHYASEAGSFVRDGLEQGHRALVMAPPSRLELLDTELGGDAAEVTFVDDDVAYAPQWNAYRVLLDFAAAAPEARSCVVAEQTLEGRSSAELVDYRRLESAINVVFAEQAVDLLCPYDAGRLPVGPPRHRTALPQRPAGRGKRVPEPRLRGSDGRPGRPVVGGATARRRHHPRVLPPLRRRGDPPDGPRASRRDRTRP